MFIRYLVSPNGTTMWDTPPKRRKTHEYSIWTNLMTRAQNKPSYFTCKNPTYDDVSVCEDWLDFQKFAGWFTSQPNFKKVDRAGDFYQLDKDWLVFGNKEYSPEHCILVPREVNTFISFTRTRKSGQLPGAHFRVRDGVWMASFTSICGGRQEWCGQFKTELEAHLAWKKRKTEDALILAERNPHVDQRIVGKLLNFSECIDELLMVDKHGRPD